MMRWHVRTARCSSMFVAGVLIMGAAAPDRAPFFHERKEVAGLAIVFGAEPEPALHEEIQFLRWRVSTLGNDAPYTALAGAEVRITRTGEDFGPYPLRAVRGTPGQYEPRHIFPEPGAYGSVLSFKKGEEQTVHTVDFAFTINDRADIEIPGQ